MGCLDKALLKSYFVDMENVPQIILASDSPRRAEILKNMGFNVLKCSHKLDEAAVSKTLSGLSVSDFAKEISKQKALSIRDDFKGSIILGADTVVYALGKVLGKPETKDEALSFIRLLSDNKHSVITGYTLVLGDKIVSRAVSTDIYVKKMSDDEIKSYVENEDIMDAAGAYKIQGKFSLFITRLEGDYYNVVGLPVGSIYDYIKELMGF